MDGKLSKSGGKMTGDLNMGNRDIIGVSSISTYGNSTNTFTQQFQDIWSGGVSQYKQVVFMYGNPTELVPARIGNPIVDDHAATKKYVDEINSIKYIRCFRNFFDSTLNKWIQLYIPSDCIVNDYGSTFEIVGNRIRLKRTGLFSLSAVVTLKTTSAGVVGVKYTYWRYDESYDPKYGTTICRQTHHFSTEFEAVTASGLFYGLSGDYISIELFHDVRIAEDSGLDIRIGMV